MTARGSSTPAAQAGGASGKAPVLSRKARAAIDAIENDLQRKREAQMREIASAKSEAELQELAEEAEVEQASESELSVEQLAGIPVEVNPLVEKWIYYFSVKDRDRFQRFLDRGSQYREVVENILQENGVPTELFYLAMIESGYTTHAKSVASAVGVWQFIRGTGKRYGLETNYYVDERRDPIRSTEAAAKYLKGLYTAFNSWHLAMAAYNCGEHRVLNAILKARSRDYWTLVDRKALPNETSNYVPKFLAALIIGQDPEKFGFRAPREERYPNLEAVEVPSSVHLKKISELTDVSYEELKKVNPHIRRGLTPPGSSTYEIWVPEEKAASVKTASADLNRHRVRGLRQVASTSDRSKHYYRVKRGDSLGLIARKFGLSVSHLKRINGIRGNRILAGKSLRVSTKTYHPSRSARYRVRRGDNLSSIAKRFGMSVGQLKRLNSLRRNTIYVGQSLRIAERI